MNPAGAAGPSGQRGGRGLRRLLGALAGLLAAAAGLGAGELVAAFVGPSSSPVVAVGNASIALTPEWLKRFAITTFGERDKLALVVGTLVVLALYALLVGVVSLRSRRLGAVGIALFGLLGAVAAVTRPAGRPVDGLPSFVGAAVGIAVLRFLVAALAAPDTERATDDACVPAMDRRRFVLAGGVVLGAAVLAGGGGRLLQRRFAVAGERSRLVLPPPSSPAAAVPAGADLASRVRGLTPLFTGNADFYRVDTAIVVPQVAPDTYRLTMTGMFDSPRAYSLADLYGRSDLIERDVTLTCVSNEVGGTLAGTARWLGVPLAAVLRENGVQARSSQLVCRSVDGMTIGTPTRAALDVEDAMLAIGMNGEPLPVEHGFPVRMVVPGLYGYVSACKWLTRIEASTFGAFDAYWVQRLWAQQGPIKIESRIDTPAGDSTFAPGRRPVAGVAWAQTRGISRVEVRIDDEPWTAAQLAPSLGDDLWRQWVLPVDFRPGNHRISARATSGHGELQTERVADPFPDGASGWHTIDVTVR